MNALPAPAPAGNAISVQDIFYIVFRQKWKIVICTVLGLVAATVAWFLNPPPYQSDAMLFIRYVMENPTPGAPDSGDRAVSPSGRGEGIMTTEMEILSSLDTALSVADIVGPDKLLPGIKDAKLRTRERAAAAVRAGLSLQPFESIIHLQYRNTDPTLVQPVLAAVVETYKKKHIEVHSGGGIVADFLSQETDQFRSRLAQTEDELRKAKAKAGIISVADSQKQLESAESQIDSQLMQANAELAERDAIYREMLHNLPSSAAAAAAAKAAEITAAAAAAPVPARIPESDLLAYRQALTHIDSASKLLDNLSLQLTDQAPPVQRAKAQLNDAEQQRRDLEKKYPQLVEGLPSAARGGVNGPTSGASAATLAVANEAIHLSGLKNRIAFLTATLNKLRAKELKIDESEGSISELQRQKELDEANYRYYSTRLEASRIDEALGAGRALNIAEIQTPTPPTVDYGPLRKLVGKIAGGGLALGLAWAFVIEFYWDHSVRRPQDVERRLGVPLFLSMPKFADGGENRHVFHETLRDRLMAYFESQGLTHKPKLVAVTGVGKNSGVTTTATGLAQSLSETHDGNVLLVDMTQSQGSAQQFSHGKAICGFDELLETRNSAQVQDNLYVVGAEPNNDKLSRALPTRFQRLIPQLKASDFDYIIFDMPAVNQISITPRLAQFMDMVLLVLESESTDRELAKQATALLTQSRTHVGAVLNKTVNYVPSRAHHEFLGSS